MEITSVGLEGILALLPLCLFSILAFWKASDVLFIILFGVAVMTGLAAPDIINGNYNTTSLGISVGVLLVAYGILCAGWSFRLMFWRG